MQTTGLIQVQPIYNLQQGFDFRLPQYRRKVFLDFYKFHTKYRGHAGAVYYAIPHIINELKLNKEQAYWLCFINGCSQNIVTSYIIFKKFSNIHKLNLHKLKEWFYQNYKLFGWDTDRRYFKNSFIQCIQNYLTLLNGKTQTEFFSNICNTNNAHTNFKKLWQVVNNEFLYFGRLSAFSYIEYLNIMGLNVECNELFLDDLKGSKSHRNGLCKVLGRDDLDWTKSNAVTYTDNIINQLKTQGQLLLQEAKQYINLPFVNYFTLETTLCCYKGWHRVNRRYPNVYNDMFYDRITHAEQKWQTKFNIFHAARKKYLPKYLRCEHNPSKLKLCKEKQNHYRLTGQVIMMEHEYPYYKNNFRTNTLWQ